MSGSKANQRPKKRHCKDCALSIALDKVIDASGYPFDKDRASRKTLIRYMFGHYVRVYKDKNATKKTLLNGIPVYLEEEMYELLYTVSDLLGDSDDD